MQMMAMQPKTRFNNVNKFGICFIDSGYYASLLLSGNMAVNYRNIKVVPRNIKPGYTNCIAAYR